MPVVGADGTYTLGEPVPEVDATLTEAGAPADAAAVGEAIEAISPDDAAVDGKPWTSQHIVDMLCPPLEASGNPVTCTPVAGYPLGVKASWGPRQAGTGDPYPPGGGANLLDMAMCTPVGSTYTFGMTCEIDGDVVTVSGVPNIEVERLYSFNIISNSQTELRGQGYVITPFAIEGTIQAAFGLSTADDPHIAISTELYPGVENTIKLRLTCSQNALTAYAPYSNIRPITGLDEVTVTLSDGVGAGTTATLTLPKEVYGGEVDVATRQGQETYAMVELDGTENISMSQIQGYNRFSINEAVPGIISATGANLNMVCSHYAVASDPIHGNTKNNAMAGYASTTTIFIRDDAQASVGEYKSYLAAQAAAGTPVTIAYKLATPQPIQATGSQSLPAISGENVLITNADSLTVTGRADPVATVQALADRVAALEQAAVNSINNTTEG